MNDDFTRTVAVTSPDTPPPNFIRALFRLVLAALALAGLAGGLFQLYLCLRLTARLMNQ